MPSIYVTGFLTDTSTLANFEPWMASHKRLAAALQWSDEMHGFQWRTGSAGDMLGKWPLPLNIAALVARRSSPTASTTS